jgi:hypothetical protein
VAKWEMKVERILEVGHEISSDALPSLAVLAAWPEASLDGLGWMEKARQAARRKAVGLLQREAVAHTADIDGAKRMLWKFVGLEFAQEYYRCDWYSLKDISRLYLEEISI